MREKRPRYPGDKMPPANPLRSLAKAVLDARDTPFFRDHRAGIWIRGVVLGFGEDADYQKNRDEAKTWFNQAALNRMSKLHEKFIWLRDLMDRELAFRSHLWKDDRYGGDVSDGTAKGRHKR